MTTYVFWDIDGTLLTTARAGIFDSSPTAQYAAFTSSRRSPSLARSTEAPIVVVKTRACLPLRVVNMRVHATGIIGLFGGPSTGGSFGCMPVSTWPSSRIVASAGGDAV